MTTTQEKWEELHSLPRHRTQYPNEYAARFLFGNYSRDLTERKEIKILDLGCGAGRHTRMFAEQGFDTYAIDLSREGIRYTTEMLESCKLSADIRQGDMTQLPYDDEFFDGVLSFGVFYYISGEGVKQAISEMFRVLKPGGIAMIIMRTDNDYRFGKGEEVSRNSFLLKTEETREAGMVVHFMTEQDVKDEFSAFSSISFEKEEFTAENRSILNSDWIITVKK